jgi:hypothetical protein
MVPGETNPRGRHDDRGLCRDGDSNRVAVRGSRRSSELADLADAHPSVPAYIQRHRACAKHTSTDPAVDADANRDIAPLLRAHFQSSRLERAVTSARVQNQSRAASNVAARCYRRVCADRSWHRLGVRRGGDPDAWTQASRPRVRLGEDPGAWT